MERLTKIPARDDGGVSHAIVGLAQNHFAFCRFAIVRMNEIEERSVDYALKQRMSDPLPDLIPPNLRHNQIVCKTANAATQKPQPGRSAKLLRFLKEHLHANTDAEQRRSFSDAFAHQLIESAFSEGLHACPKRPNSGQHQTLRPAQDFLIGTHHRGAAGRGKCLLD